MDNDKAHPKLPLYARLPINRCNVPADILGSLTFQRHPIPLMLDGVDALHRRLFEMLSPIGEPAERSELFMEYMKAHFQLDHPEEMGYVKGDGLDRHRADYLRLIRGWSFDVDGREGAVLKGWAESRFGLLPRHHRGAIDRPGDESYLGYQLARAEGLYNTNALESQLDLLYTYCQYELARQHPGKTHLRLFRGVNHAEELEKFGRSREGKVILLCNNLSSFSRSPERADEFGDRLIETEVPLAKVVFYDGLLPRLKGEDEVVVLGGLMAVRLH